MFSKNIGLINSGVVCPTAAESSLEERTTLPFHNPTFFSYTLTGKYLTNSATHIKLIFCSFRLHISSLALLAIPVSVRL